MSGPIETKPLDRDGEFVPVKRVEDPSTLVAGNQLVSMRDLHVVTLERRKDEVDGPGWWLWPPRSGGLHDSVIVDEYRLIPAEPQPWRLARA